MVISCAVIVEGAVTVEWAHAVDQEEAVSGPVCAGTAGVYSLVTSGSAIAAMMKAAQGRSRRPVTAGGRGTGLQKLRRSRLSLERGQVLAFVKVKWYLDKKCLARAYDVSDFTSGNNDKTCRGRMSSALTPVMP